MPDPLARGADPGRTPRHTTTRGTDEPHETAGTHWAVLALPLSAAFVDQAPTYARAQTSKQALSGQRLHQLHRPIRRTSLPQRRTPRSGRPTVFRRPALDGGSTAAGRRLPPASPAPQLGVQLDRGDPPGSDRRRLQSRLGASLPPPPKGHPSFTTTDAASESPRETDGRLRLNKSGIGAVQRARPSNVPRTNLTSTHAPFASRGLFDKRAVEPTTGGGPVEGRTRGKGKTDTYRHGDATPNGADKLGHCEVRMSAPGSVPAVSPPAARHPPGPTGRYRRDSSSRQGVLPTTPFGTGTRTAPDHGAGSSIGSRPAASLPPRLLGPRILRRCAPPP